MPPSAQKKNPPQEVGLRYTIQWLAAKLFNYTPEGSYFREEIPTPKNKFKKKRREHIQHIVDVKDAFKVGEPVVFEIDDPTREKEPIVGFCIAVSDLAVVVAEGMTFHDIAHALTFPMSYIRVESATRGEKAKGSVVVSFPLTPKDVHAHAGSKAR